MAFSLPKSPCMLLAWCICLSQSVVAEELPRLNITKQVNPVGSLDESSAALDIAITPRQQLKFYGLHVKAIDKNISNRLQLQYALDMGSQRTLDIRTTTDFDEYRDGKSVHRIALQQRLPSRLISSNLQLLYQKREHVNAVTEMAFNVSKLLRFDGKPLVNFKAKAIWNLQLSDGLATTRHETRWTLNKKFNFAQNRSVALTGTLRWRDKYQPDTEREEALGGWLIARFNLSPAVNAKLRHVAHDEFNNELTEISAVFSGSLWQSNVLLEAGTDNYHNGFLQLSATKAWR